MYKFILEFFRSMRKSAGKCNFVPKFEIYSPKLLMSYQCKNNTKKSNLHLLKSVSLDFSTFVATMPLKKICLQKLKWLVPKWVYKNWNLNPYTIWGCNFQYQYMIPLQAFFSLFICLFDYLRCKFSQMQQNENLC